MTDPRHRLRPLLHSGVPFKVKAALDEITALDDPALYDWVLDVAYVADLANSPFWLWRYGDSQEFCHPSLEPDQVLRLVAHGNSTLAARMRGAITHLGIQLGPNRREEPFLDVSPIGRMREVTRLRLMPLEPPSGHFEWRAALAAGPRCLLLGFDAIGGMSSLEHLTVMAGSGIDLAPLAQLERLRHVELIACDTADLTPLASTSVETIILAGCNQVTAVDALPASLRRLRVEDLPALTSIDGVTSAPRLEVLQVLGVSLALPALPPSVQVTFQPERPPYTS